MKNRNWPKLASLVEQGNIQISPLFEDGRFLDALAIKSCFREYGPALELEREAGGLAYPIMLEGLTHPVFNWLIHEKEEQQMFLRGILPFFENHATVGGGSLENPGERRRLGTAQDVLS